MKRGFREFLGSVCKGVVAGIVCIGCAAAVLGQTKQEPGWPTYGSDAGGTRYSTAAQIDRSNVDKMKVAWTYRTGALEQSKRLINKAAFEATPILVDGKLYLSTPYNHVIALDPGTGEKLWEYDPGVNLERNYSEVTSRGVSAWREIVSSNSLAACRLRILIGTLDARLIAVDGETGKPCADFGNAGTVDLNKDAATQTEWTGGYQVTSPPAIYRDLVIVGSSIADNWKVDAGRGIVRAFDARTGKLRWTWDPIPWAQKIATAYRWRECVGSFFAGCRTRSDFCADGECRAGLLWGNSQGRRQMGELGGGVAGFDGRLRVGISSGASRFVGLRRGGTADAVHVEGRNTGGGCQHEDGARVCAEPLDREAPAAG